jgi:hypothetical protein
VGQSPAPPHYRKPLGGSLQNKVNFNTRMKMISVQSNDFRQPIENAIFGKKQVVIWHQLPASGGMQEWFLIDNLAALDKVISKGRVASAFTAYVWHEVLPLQGINQAWVTKALTALENESQNLMLLIKSDLQNHFEPIQLTWVGDSDDVYNYYEKHSDSKVVVGRIPSMSFGELVRGYFPDENGNPKSAPY